MDFHGFCDSDWAGDQDTRRSTTGFLAFMAGGPIAWQSRLQTTIAASSMEAEERVGEEPGLLVCCVCGGGAEGAENGALQTSLYES